MTTPEKIRKLRAMTEALERKHGYFILQIPFSDFLVLLANVQLAIRHPGNQGYTAQIGRRICEDIIASMEKASPGIAELMNEGFDPKHDVPVRK